MILVTLGTNDKSFHRLLQAVERLIDKGIICDEVIVQAGMTEYSSDKMKIVDLLPMEEMESLIEQCQMLITHGGVGSIISGLNHEKTVLAVPRLAKYGEHVNDHQIQIIQNFKRMGYIIGLDGVEDLEEAINKAEMFTSQKYCSNTENMIALVRHHINS